MSVDLFIPEDAKKIGGWFSGGADSTLLLFLLTKKISQLFYKGLVETMMVVT